MKIVLSVSLSDINKCYLETRNLKFRELEIPELGKLGNLKFRELRKLGISELGNFRTHSRLSPETVYDPAVIYGRVLGLQSSPRSIKINAILVHELALLATAMFDFP